MKAKFVVIRYLKYTLLSEVFLDFSVLLIFLRMRELRVAKRRGRETSGYLGLNWPSGSDWLIVLQTRQSIWLVCLIGYTEGTVKISVTALLEVREGICLQNTSVLRLYRELFDMDYVSDCVSSKNFWPRYSWSVFQRLKVSPNIKRKPCSQSLIARMCSSYCQPDMESQLYFSCSLMSSSTCTCQAVHTLVDSHIRELRNGGISTASLNSEDVDENNLLKEAYAFLFGSPESFLQNEKWRNMLRSNA